MTVSEAIRRANDLRANELRDEQKTAWLYNLEGEIADFMHEPVTPVSEYPQSDPELLMPAPHDDIYYLYLCAMIDSYHQEEGQYNNDMALFNAAMAGARAWWRRTHEAPKREYWKVW